MKLYIRTRMDGQKEQIKSAWANLLVCNKIINIT